MTRHYPDLGSASDWLKQISHVVWPIRSHIISVEFLRSFLRRHFAGKPVVVSQSVGCFLRLLNCHAGYPYLGTASNNWRAICKEIPCQKGNELSNEALQLRCGRNDCKQGILTSQAKGHCFLWLKITRFLTVQLYMKLLNHSDNIHCENLFFSSLCLVPEKFDVKSWVWEDLLSKQENDCKKCALPTQFTTDGDSIFCLCFAKWRKCFSSKKLSLHRRCNLTTVSKVSKAVPISLSWKRILELFCRKT